MHVLRLPQVLAKTGLSKTTTYLMIGEGRFPAPVRIGQRAVGWVEAEVDNWLAVRCGMRPVG